MNDIRNNRIAEILHDLGAKFLNEENNGSSLLTVTSVTLSPDEKRATILFTVFPDTFEKTALEFAKRKRSEFKQYIKDHSKLGKIPMVDFEIDLGEQHILKIESLLNEG